MRGRSLPTLAFGLVVLVLIALGRNEATADDPPTPTRSDPVQIHYLEIVTPDVDAQCAMLERAYGTSFGEPIAAMGNARTASLADGGTIGVRAPLHEAEDPVVRPYVLVDDIAAAVAAAEAAGALVAHPPLEIPGEGTFAIVIQGGIHHGFWQLP